MSQQILIEYCPKCRTQNAVSMGDPEDCTGPDFDGIECYKCGEKILFEYSTWEYCSDEPYFEKGEPLANFIREPK